MGDIAIVTGAAGALGAEVARSLSRRGCRLVLADSERAKDGLTALASELGGAAVMSGDLATQAAWDEALPRLERELGGAPSLAALVAGAYRGGAPLDATTDDGVWRTMMNANLETVYRALRALLPSMLAHGRGSIVAVGSRAAVQPWTSGGSAAYAASKAAVVALVQAVAAEALPRGVRVNAVLPSTLDTPANRAAMPRADPSRWVSVSSAAEVIAYLLGDGAQDVSGAAVPVYGRA